MTIHWGEGVSPSLAPQGASMKESMPVDRSVLLYTQTHCRSAPVGACEGETPSPQNALVSSSPPCLVRRVRLPQDGKEQSVR